MLISHRHLRCKMEMLLIYLMLEVPADNISYSFIFDCILINVTVIYNNLIGKLFYPVEDHYTQVRAK